MEDIQFGDESKTFNPYVGVILVFCFLIPICLVCIGGQCVGIISKLFIQLYFWPMLMVTAQLPTPPAVPSAFLAINLVYTPIFFSPLLLWKYTRKTKWLVLQGVIFSAVIALGTALALQGYLFVK